MAFFYQNFNMYSPKIKFFYRAMGIALDSVVTGCNITCFKIDKKHLSYCKEWDTSDISNTSHEEENQGVS